MEVNRIIPAPPPPGDVNIVLTPDEATALLTILTLWKRVVRATHLIPVYRDRSLVYSRAYKVASRLRLLLLDNHVEEPTLARSMNVEPDPRD